MQTNTITSQQKKCLLELLDAFLEVCNKYNLTYYMAGGSCIGAVRHKGFIPWDDDIDVYMPRNDFEKLLALPDEVWVNNVQLCSIYKTKNYRYDFPKLELKNTTVIERLYPNYVGGVFLDIFPLDAVPTNEEDRKIQLGKLNKIVSNYVKSYIKHDSDCSNIIDLLFTKINRLFAGKKFIKKWEKLVSKNPIDGDFVIDYHNYWSVGPVPYEYFKGGYEAIFEGRKVMLPAKYHNYLSHRFGDYMQLPPIEKRFAHKFDYVNYDRRISSDEANKILKGIHTRYKYRYSLKNEIKRFIKFFIK